MYIFGILTSNPTTWLKQNLFSFLSSKNCLQAPYLSDLQSDSDMDIIPNSGNILIQEHCFSVILGVFNWSNFSHLLTSRAVGAIPPSPLTVRWPKKYTFSWQLPIENPMLNEKNSLSLYYPSFDRTKEQIYWNFSQREQVSWTTICESFKICKMKNPSLAMFIYPFRNTW